MVSFQMSPETYMVLSFVYQLSCSWSPFPFSIFRQTMDHFHQVPSCAKAPRTRSAFGWFGLNHDTAAGICQNNNIILSPVPFTKVFLSDQGQATVHEVSCMHRGGLTSQLYGRYMYDNDLVPICIYMFANFQYFKCSTKTHNNMYIQWYLL